MKAATSSPKGAELEPKVSKCLPKTPRAEPKNDKNTSRNRSSEKVAKRKAKRSIPRQCLGGIFDVKSEKIDEKSIPQKASKNDAKIIKKWIRNNVKSYRKFDFFAKW